MLFCNLLACSGHNNCIALSAAKCFACFLFEKLPFPYSLFLIYTVQTNGFVASSIVGSILTEMKKGYLEL